MGEENNGKSLEIGKLIGSLQALEKGQDAIFREISEIQSCSSDIKQRSSVLESQISRNESDINGIGKKVDILKDELNKKYDDLKKETEEKLKESRNELSGKMMRQTVTITAVLALFMTFLSIWVYILKPGIKTIEVPKDKLGDVKYEIQNGQIQK